MTLALATLVNLLVGATVRHFHEKIQGTFLTWLLKREEKTLGVALNEFDTDELDAGTESRRTAG